MISTIIKASPFFWPFIIEVFKKPPRKHYDDSRRYLYTFFMLIVGLSTAMTFQFIGAQKMYNAQHDDFMKISAELRDTTQARYIADAQIINLKNAVASRDRAISRLEGQLTVYTTSDNVMERELRELRKSYTELEAKAKFLTEDRERLIKEKETWRGRK